MNLRFKNILIYGLGLMGGSVARDLQRIRAAENLPLQITGVVRSARSRLQALQQELADEVYASEELERPLDFGQYDLILLSIPVAASIRFMESLPVLHSDNHEPVVIDVGSTKEVLSRAYYEGHHYRRFIFIGCHPMAGSEMAGPTAAREFLYRGKLCFVTEPDLERMGQDLRPELLDRFQQARRDIRDFWETLGAVTWPVPPHLHDEALAYLSHSPHLLAALITQWAENNPTVNSLTRSAPIPLIGGGFKDMVRISGSNPEMWTEIMQTNRENIARSLRDFRDMLDECLRMVDGNSPADWYRFFERAFEAKKFITEGQPPD